MGRDQIIGEIVALKSLLSDTDYKIIKFAESLAGCGSVIELLATVKTFYSEFGEIVQSRKCWREKINELEGILEQIDAEPYDSSYD